MDRDYFTISEWGYWATAGDETLFRASLDTEREIINGVVSDTYDATVQGTRTSTNPVGGSATWVGGVRAIDANLAPVTGTSGLVFDFDTSTIDVDFTQLSGGHSNISWHDLSVADGAFEDGDTLDGSFYGSNHEGVAGNFDHADLRGLFGALRE